ncbi:MAG: DUF2169 domain-containing protein [Deltaproteobacteria bacterium]|nr:DUF2169 domain-containing protein [Deltaproteobacteria bacterium]MBW2537520.1 DUF2169 domain-containing protein [Deltaproteobacteria bacterium]
MIVAKLSYSLEPTECTPLASAMPLVAKERSRDGSASSSIQAPTDLVPFKNKPEFMVIGSAFAPPNHTGSDLTVAIEVAGHRKALRVRGKTQVPARPAAGSPPAPNSWPLGWEHALESDGNPAGVGPDAPPTIFPEHGDPRSVGFSPISSRWPSRRRRLGSFESSWSDDHFQWCVLDGRFDGLYFQAAPADQWLDELPTEIPLVLEHLHGAHARLETRIVGPTPRARAERAGGTREEIQLRADTLVVDTDRATVSVTWRGHLELARPEEAGTVQFGLANGAEVAWIDESAGELDELDADTMATERFNDDERSAQGSRPPKPSRPHIDMPRYDGEDATAEAVPIPRQSEPAWLARRRSASSVPRPSSIPPALSSQIPPPPSTVSEVPPPLPPPLPRPRANPSVRPPNPLGKPLGGAAKPETKSTAPPPGPAPLQPERSARPTPETGPVEVVWLDDDAAARARQDETLAKLLPAKSEPPPPPKPRRGEVPPPPPPPPDPRAEQDDARRDVCIALADARSTPLTALQSRLTTALSQGSRQPPLVVVGGELGLSFDDAEALRITCSLAKPFEAHDKSLSKAVSLAGEAADALADAPTMTRPLQARVVDAWRQANRELPPDYLERNVRRALLEKRAYRRVRVLGERFIVAVLAGPNGPTLPVYVPEAAAEYLPLYDSFNARLLAQVVARQDEAEPHPVALSVLAVGRRIALGAGSRSP